MSGGDLPPSNSFSVAQQQTFLNHNAGNHFQSPLSHAAVAQSERTAIEQKDPYTAGVNSQPEGAYKTMNPATKGRELCVDRFGCGVTEANAKSIFIRRMLISTYTLEISLYQKEIHGEKYCPEICRLRQTHLNLISIDFCNGVIGFQ